MERLEARLALDASMLRITELLASNDDGLLDADGEASDWIEIYNAGVDTVDLTGLHLTDSASNLSKWTFPSGFSLDPGGYRIIFASDKNGVRGAGELHTNFRLSADGEFLGLVAADGTTIIDQFAPGFPSQVEDVSYGPAMTPTGASTTLVAAGAQARAWVPTSSQYDATWKSVGFNQAPFNIVGPTGFGYELSPGDPTNFTAEIATSVPSTTRSLYVRIPFTLTTLAGIDELMLRMRYDDGFVAYLNGVEIAEANAPETVQWNSIASAAHADSAAELFQSFDVSAGIPNLRVGQNVLAIHALNVNGGTDMLMTPELIARPSTLDAPTELGYFETPTPGYGNGQNLAGFVGEPTFSVPHGYYTSTQSVSLATSTPGAVIVYTTNGSTPTVNASLTPTNGTLYTGPININSTTPLRAVAFKADFKPSFIASSTYLFVNDIINQSPSGQAPAGWAPDGLNGQQMDYGIDPDIIALYGATAVKNSLLSIPTVAITTDLANLFNASTGIYVNAANRGRDWERLSSVELINPDGSTGFTVNAGLRIRGGYSRGDFNPKHAFRFYFRSEYGDGKLQYPLFGAEGVSEFDVLDLRSEQNYSWSSEGNIQNSLVREVFGRDLQADLGQPYSRSRYYHLYIDGVYWGVSMTQERVEEFYGESYFGGDEADYDVVKHGLADVGGTEVSAGNDDAWQLLFNLAEGLSGNPAANAINYWTMQGLNPDGTRNATLPVLLDVDNLIDYMSIIFYTGGYDSGISRFLGDDKANNWFGIYNRVAADQGFQFFIHDNEHSLGAESNTHGTQFIDRTGPFNFGNQSAFAQFNPGYLHQDLLAHPEYKQRFIDRTQQLYFNGGPMTPAASIARLDERLAQVDGAINGEAARWGDAQVATPRNKATWQTEINWIRNTYFPARSTTVLNQLRGDGLYTSFSAPAFNQHGGQVENGFELTITASPGTIYYTTDGVTDPRLVGGGVNPSAAVTAYAGPISLLTSSTVKARLRTASGQWSGLVEASFAVAPALGDYDANGVRDGADFLVWQQQYGSPASPAGIGADGDYSGAVNDIDLIVWKIGFGEPIGASSPATAAALVVGDSVAPIAPAPSLRSAPGRRGQWSLWSEAADEALAATTQWRRLAQSPGDDSFRGSPTARKLARETSGNALGSTPQRSLAEGRLSCDLGDSP